MASIFPARPEPQFLPDECHLFQESPTPVQQRFNPPPSPPPRVRSHYRPFSTLYTESPYIELDRKAVRLQHSYSSGGLQALNVMGISLKPKSKKDSPTSTPRDRDGSVSQVSAPLKLKGKKSPGQEIERPSTSSGVMRTSPTLVQMKKKRSMVSLFTSSADASASGSSVEPNAGRRRSPLGARHVISPPPSTSESKTSSKTSLTSGKAVSFEGYADDEYNGAFESSHVFLPKHIWAKRHNMTLHPYHEEVPYMQAYDPILLESDRYTDQLLRRLTYGSPSFHDFRKPPAMVLDLGCGEGHWALHASSVWTEARITGLDIVDITLPAFKTTKNLFFVQADFLERLPFPGNTFDFVRIANLALCIPRDKWEDLFREIRRILMPGGRLEVIDDQIQFPYAKVPTSEPVGRNESGSSLDMDDLAEQDLLDGETLQGNETEATLNSSNGSQPSSFETKLSRITESATVRPCDTRSMSEYLPVAPQSSTLRKAQKHAREHKTYAAEARQLAVAQQVHASRELEKIFRLMLRRQYGISYRPADHIVKYLHNVFGEENAGKKFSFHIKLAPTLLLPSEEDEAVSLKVDVVERDDVASVRSMAMVSSPHSGSEPSLEKEKKKNWIGGDREKQKAKKADKERRKAELNGASDTISRTSSERSSLESPMPGASLYPASMNAKAAKRLGLTLPDIPTTPVNQKGSPLQGLGVRQDLVTPTQAKSPSRRLSMFLSTPMIPPSATSTMSTPPMTIVNAKLADRLGINEGMEKPKHKPRKQFPLAQAPGLLVWGPMAYIPLNPVELEMHACKNMHTLLGCRAALADFFATQVDERGKRLVAEDEFDDIVWDYECFRRRRLNWPSEIVDPSDDDEFSSISMFSSDTTPPKHSRTSPPPSSSKTDDISDTLNGPNRPDLTHVRTIRVFHAVKSGSPPVLNIFRTPSSSPPHVS